MTAITKIRFQPVDLGAALDFSGNIGVLVRPGGIDGTWLTELDGKVGGALSRLCRSRKFKSLNKCDSVEIAFPSGIAAESLIVVKLQANANEIDTRKAGASFGSKLGSSDMLLLLDGHSRAETVLQGLALRAYEFTDHKTKKKKNKFPKGRVTAMVAKPDEVNRKFAPLRAAVEGVFLTRDLVSEPSNILTTIEFANRLEHLREFGVEVEVLGESELRNIGMRSLLGVGQGSSSPSCVVVMRWGGSNRRPLALVGKGVVFDTGGISLKPAAGMEKMTFDMGGAGTVAGVMKTIALRKSKSSVVGIVGLVENMPDGNAQRPGDVVKSLKGDTIEIVNTDAEGRLVLADLLWYVQQRYKPTSIVDFATLTGAIIVALGHEHAGLFSNDDKFCGALLSSASKSGEGAWRMPTGPAYDKQLKSAIADMKNVGGRSAGAVTAAMFLRRFVGSKVPWAHLDIAGVVSTSSSTDLAPAGATGWGVRTLDKLILDKFEK